MSWYASLENPEILAIDSSIAKVENDSFITAFSNLMTRYDVDINPQELSQAFQEINLTSLTWSAITNYDSNVTLGNVGLPQVWPKTENAIVRLKAVNPSTGEIIDHYCLIADPETNTIIDSFDGEVKQPEVYGPPLAYATYNHALLDDVASNEDPVSDIFNKPPRKGSTYTMMLHDNIWEVALRLNLSGTELIEHNDIEDPSNIPVGTVLHLPYNIVYIERPSIRYELYDEPKQMHVAKPEGIKRWSFGNVSSWKDLHGTGFYSYGTNIDVVAIAKVPIGEETAAYYMDSRALGQYSVTGKVDATTGFNWTDLDMGYMEKQQITKPTPPPPPEPIVEPVKTVPVKEVYAPNLWKSTYKAFSKPAIYVSNRTILVHELDGRRPDRMFMINKQVLISGVFMHEGTAYGRPHGSAKNGYWFGIPMSDLISENELYNTELDLPTRATMKNGQLTIQERGVVALSQLFALRIKIALWLKEIQNKRSS